MAYTFDTENKWIIIPGAEVSTNMQDVYDDCMDWADSQEGMVWDIPVAAYGKIELSPGVYTDIIYVLQGGWKLRYYVGDYTAIVVGTVVTDDQTARTSLPYGSSIELTFEVATKATVVQVGGAIADQVWDADITEYSDVDSFGEMIQVIKDWAELAAVK